MGQRVMKPMGEFLPKSIRRLALFVAGARFVVEVAWTLDVGVLQMLGPGADLARTAFRERFEI